MLTATSTVLLLLWLQQETSTYAEFFKFFVGPEYNPTYFMADAAGSITAGFDKFEGNTL
jgi:hypothetical protein